MAKHKGPDEAIKALMAKHAKGELHCSGQIRCRFKMAMAESGVLEKGNQ